MVVAQDAEPYTRLNWHMISSNQLSQHTLRKKKMTNKKMEKNTQEFVKWIIANISELHLDCDLIHQKALEFGIVENADEAGIMYYLSKDFCDYCAGCKVR